ncbi:MAG: carboxypeptidase M32 [Clostridia bacterium]|nr:carboxypeptidase M32 [Clostridia bacterium]
MELQEMLERLDALQRRMQAYNHAIGLVDYDGATAAPSGAAANRAETLAILSEEAYKLSTGEETVALLDGLRARKDELDPTHRRIVEEMIRDIDDMRKVPMEEYVAYQRLVSESDAVWHQAKEKSDYAMFMPYLERMIEANKRLMSYMRPGVPTYDALLDRFERGLTRARCDEFFSLVRKELVPFIHRVTAAPQVDASPLHGYFPIEQQRRLSDYLMDVIGLDRAHIAIAETEHPFTTAFTKYDVRITTHYFERDFSSSMFSVIHEGGHALYDQHPADELAYTVLGGGVSMGIHESQSRFYENIIARSRPFVSLIAPKLRALFPALAEVSDEALYLAFNRAEPSLIRTEADELTYCLHILIRYELEQRLFDGELTVQELPAAWNQLYRDYLGVEVPSDREGVLQDTHWADGLFGYFPSYALGSAYGAHMLHVMRETVDVEGAIAKGDLSPIARWLEERIWRFGGLKDPGVLLEEALGEPFDPMHYVRYLKKKYSEIYGLE